MDFLPYAKQTIEEDDINDFIDTLKSDFLTTGLKVNEFERAIYEVANAKYCVSVSNGTAALHLAALALLNEGDIVLTTPNSFIATSNSILYAKATPVFVDICEDGSIDLNLCEDILKQDASIKAIFAVSFSGKILDKKRLKYLKNTYNIKILEDNAHTMGVKLTYSDISTFSFHPVKHIATGEGGAVVTNDKALYEKIKMLRNHGQDDKHQMLDLGFNYRLSDISSTLGLSQIKKLDTFIHQRQEIAKRYDKAFQNTIVKPLYPYTNSSLYHLYVVRVDFSKLDITKNEVIIKMREKKIGLQVHYRPINKQPYYKNIGYGDEQTPMMDRYFQECLSIPCYPLLSEDEQQYVINSLLEVLNV
ncbi:MAG: aminotransferase class V-fold PLP-dependent enzyme [Sulfurimonas sp.]|jgi:UDP-4-amino-4,6-dideoxy-L-N-acetyl-beta-L-altrosamine transaminase|nr:aminotransferase class V-fold PLP-dependent enzyme [Sulfurimonas sp.]